MSKNPSDSIYRIPPYYYLHVLDQNLNVTRLEIGPQTFIRQDNERYPHQPMFKNWFPYFYRTIARSFGTRVFETKFILMFNIIPIIIWTKLL